MISRLIEKLFGGRDPRFHGGDVPRSEPGACIPRHPRRSGEKAGIDCDEVRAASSDFIDGDLGSDVSAKIRAHLEQCEPCAAFVRTLRATVVMLGSTAPSPAPAGFRERVYERIRGS